MNMKASETSSAKESQFELKYCERCGGLWLRPTGGGQVYCAKCAQEMAEMPPVSYERKGVRGARMPSGPRWGMDDRQMESFEDYDEDLDVTGGVA
jgi:hypothetical protein